MPQCHAIIAVDFASSLDGANTTRYWTKTGWTDTESVATRYTDADAETVLDNLLYFGTHRPYLIPQAMYVLVADNQRTGERRFFAGYYSCGNIWRKNAWLTLASKAQRFTTYQQAFDRLGNVGSCNGHSTHRVLTIQG